VSTKRDPVSTIHGAEKAEKMGGANLIKHKKRKEKEAGHLRPVANTEKESRHQEWPKRDLIENSRKRRDILKRQVRKRNDRSVNREGGLKRA